MSILSLKTAVTWAKPLREKDRVYSRPGAPASAVSIGKVICFSTSSGGSAGAMPLTCTWLFVTSGTASTGSLTSDHTPIATPARVTSTTAQRRWTEKARMRSIISSASILSLGLAKLGLELEGVADSDFLARVSTRDDFDGAIIASANHDAPLLKSVRGPHEYDLLSPYGLDSGLGNQQPSWLFRNRNFGSDEGTGAPSTTLVRYLGDHSRGASFLVEEWANENDFALCLFGPPSRDDRDGLSFSNQGQITR